MCPENFVQKTKSYSLVTQRGHKRHKKEPFVPFVANQNVNRATIWPDRGCAPLPSGAPGVLPPLTQFTYP